MVDTENVRLWFIFAHLMKMKSTPLSRAFRWCFANYVSRKQPHFLLSLIHKIQMFSCFNKTEYSCH